MAEVRSGFICDLISQYREGEPHALEQIELSGGTVIALSYLFSVEAEPVGAELAREKALESAKSFAGKHRSHTSTAPAMESSPAVGL